jgi:hypothetical protein
MKTVIVDSHNEVLPHWFEEYLKHRLPLVIVRIDKHHDMFQECPVLPAREGRNIFDYLGRMMPHIYEYARRGLNEGNFTCPAFHYGIVGALYHFNPREEKIDAYGRVSGENTIDSPRTKIKSNIIGGKKVNLIVWDGAQTRLKNQGGKPVPASHSLSMDAFKRDLEEGRLPVVIGFDLDGLCGIDDRFLTKDAVSTRLKRARDVLECVYSPILACIARSQTPRAYVPPELVDSLQESALHLIEMKCAGFYNHIFSRESSEICRSCGSRIWR